MYAAKMQLKATRDLYYTITSEKVIYVLLQLHSLLEWLAEEGIYHGDLSMADTLMVDLNTIQLKISSFHLAVLQGNEQIALKGINSDISDGLDNPITTFKEL